MTSIWNAIFMQSCRACGAYSPTTGTSYTSVSTSFTTNIDITSYRLVNLFKWNTRTTTLHPSRAPKCTHAYALSVPGARKLLKYLQYPPFACSRALDQALSWLILDRKIKSFTVVPSLVVQRKVSMSDIDGGSSGLGSSWKETLGNGVLGN